MHPAFSLKIKDYQTQINNRTFRVKNKRKIQIKSISYTMGFDACMVTDVEKSLAAFVKKQQNVRLAKTVNVNENIAFARDKTECIFKQF